MIVYGVCKPGHALDTPDVRCVEWVSSLQTARKTAKCEARQYDARDPDCYGDCVVVRRFTLPAMSRKQLVLWALNSGETEWGEVVARYALGTGRPL